MTTRRRIGAAALAALLLGAAALACSSGTEGPDGSPPTDPGAEVHPLVDRTFVSTTVTEDGTATELIEGTRITLGFGHDELRANAGCNHLFGDLAIVSDTIVVPTMGGTEMGCPGGRQEQDVWLVDVMTSSPTWRLDGDVLIIVSGATTIELVDEDAVATYAALTGTTWNLETLVQGDTASSIPDGVVAHLVFEPDGQANGSNGCNGFGGPYTASPTTISFGLMVHTLVGCDEPEAAVESQVMAVLAGEVAYAIDGEVLTLTGAGGKGLVYRAESS